MDEIKPMYNIGDKVRVINYGSLIWQNKKFPQPELNLPVYKETDDIVWLDIHPELVGAQGIIDGVINTQNRPKYSISGIKGKHAWYHEDQIEMINKNPNNG